MKKVKSLHNFFTFEDIYQVNESVAVARSDIDLFYTLDNFHGICSNIP